VRRGGHGHGHGHGHVGRLGRAPFRVLLASCRSVSDMRTRTESSRGPGRWAHALLAGALVSFGLAACHGCRASGGPAVPPGNDAPPTLRVYFVSDLAGAIEPCGCVKDQLGGLDHAAAWLLSQRSHAPASLFVAAGPTYFTDPLLEKDHRAQDVAKAEALATSLRRLSLTAWAPAENDWAAGPDELAKLALASGAPALEANVRTDAGAPLLPTRVVTEGGVRIAFIGVGKPLGGTATAPPAEAVRFASQVVREAGANVVIALASVGRGEAKRIADAVPDLTAVVVGEAFGRGDGNTPAPPGELVGNVLVAETSNHLQAVGALDLYVRGGSYTFADASGLGDGQKRAELTRRIDELHFRIANWERDKTIAPGDITARRADLDRLEAERAALDQKPPPADGSYFRYTLQEVRDALGQDPEVKRDLASYYRFVNDTNKVALAGRFPLAADPGQPSYTGIEACSVCHKKEKAFWDKTVHAGAYAALSSQSKEFNLDCVGCHVTGYGRPGGSTVTHVDLLKDVQCEVCHGPGSLHAAKPETTPVPTSRPGPDLCVGCHHPPHVEGFDALVKMNAIVGPGHGR